MAVKTGGRAKGTPNKISSTVKENVLAVFNRLDGTAGMAKWAKENPSQFYTIYSKLLPTEVDQTTTLTGNIDLNVNFR